MPNVKFVAAVALGFLTVGCGARPPLGPTTEPLSRAAVASEAGAVASSSAGSPASLGGTWNWSETVVLHLPEAALPFFGIASEGPITIATCHDSGTLVIAQAGASFSGTATQAALCETRGGQVFVPPVFPPAFDVSEGEIMGRSFRMLFPGGEVPCPYSGSIAAEAGGVATELRGTGLCLVPGHPQNPLGLPPPGSPTKTVTWQATRP